MRHKLVGWLLIGMVVAIGWAAYAAVTAPDYEVVMGATDRLIRAVAVFTCPTVLTGARFYWVIPINGLTYLLVGLAIERLKLLPRWNLKPSR